MSTTPKTPTALDEAACSAFSSEQLRRAVNLECTCGGAAYDDPKACPACRVWHRLNIEATLAQKIEDYRGFLGLPPNNPVTDAEPSTPANTRAQGPRSV